MTQPASDLPGGNPESARALAAQVADHNRRMENHFFQISFEFWLSRKLRISCLPCSLRPSQVNGPACRGQPGSLLA